MMYFVYFIRIIFTKRHQQLNYANCRIFQNKLVVNREGREERNSPEDYDVAGRSKFRQIWGTSQLFIFWQGLSNKANAKLYILNFIKISKQIVNFEWGTWRVKSWFYWVLASHISGWSNAPDKYTLEVIVLALVWRTQTRYILRPRACIFFVWPVGIVVLAEQVKLVWWKTESLYLDKKYGCHLFGSILMKTRFVLHATQNKFGYDCCALIFACIYVSNFHQWVYLNWSRIMTQHYFGLAMFPSDWFNWEQNCELVETLL